MSDGSLPLDTRCEKDRVGHVDINVETRNPLVFEI
jgi:hypothetical protein